MVRLTLNGPDTAGERIGIFGGTFDPVHVGHLIVAEEVRAQLGLRRIVFVPAALPPHKAREPISRPEHRVRMLELAIGSNPSFALSRVDLDREGPHFTVDMLELLRERLPADAELYFIMGADSLIDLPGWRRPERIVQLAVPVVVDRPGYAPDVAALRESNPQLIERLRWVHPPLIGISSSSIERRVIAGETIRYQVPESVGAYIHENRLYVDRDQYARVRPS